MAGTLILNDDNCWMPPNWIFNNFMEFCASQCKESNHEWKQAFLEARAYSGSGHLDASQYGKDFIASISMWAEQAKNDVAELDKNTETIANHASGYIRNLNELTEMADEVIRSTR